MVAVHSMKKIVILFSLISSCVFAQKNTTPKSFGFKVEGTVRNFEGLKIFLHHKWDDQNFTDSAKVVKGKFSFNLKSQEPNMYWFTTNRDLNNPVNCIFFVEAK